ncbi:MAG: hypothetical protein DRO96_02615 [Candidatus Aenigmatarchaeota archaeon]|nr:MAG: hypothetical protein DRO96_02615 [Candidatus Aenigmarchaeota archaeon]
MLFKNEKNWKAFLSLSDETILDKILERTAIHRPAYKNAEDVKVAQLWCALIELFKYQERLNKRLSRIERLLDGMFEKERQEKEKLINSLRKF